MNDRYRERRAALIERLRDRGINDLAVLHAFDSIPRHLFVPEYFLARAYRDEALLIGQGQTISRPSTHGLYLQSLNLKGTERVLEVGTGSGYQTALLSQLVAQVFSIDRIPQLAVAARARIEGMGISNVAVKAGDGHLGWRKYAPYDAILVTACARATPPALVEQLAVGGRLLIPIGRPEAQRLHLVVRGADGGVEERIIADVQFVELKSDTGEPFVTEHVKRR